MGEEKRRAQREPTNYTALYCSGNGVRSVKIKDLSKSGAAIVFKNEIEAREGDSIILYFYGNETGTLISHLMCRVVRLFSDEGHFAMGVTFDHDRGISKIMEYLESHSGQ
ncbi:MAG: PilZ domain-containing protein [Lachnospiraceae bacterium]|nr:PilZ domain-containing protein [Lachnospiraceae bacterium]